MSHKRTVHHYEYNSIFSVIYFICSALSSFLLIPIIKNAMGMEAYGYAAVALGVVHSINIITIALTPMITRFITMSLSKGDYELAQRYYSTSVVASDAMAIGAILFSVVVSLASSTIFAVQGDFRGQVATLCVVVGLTTAVTLYSVPNLASLYHTNELYKYYGFISASQVIRVVLPLAFYRVWKPVLWLPYAGEFAVLVISAGFYVGYRRKHIPQLRFKPSDFSMALLREMVSGGAWSSLERMGKTLLSSLNSFVANLMIGPYIAGLYASLSQLQLMGTTFGTTVAGSFVPRIYELYAQDRLTELRAYLIRSSRYLSVMLGVAAGCLFVYAHPFIWLWIGVDMLEYGPAISVLALTILLANSTEVYVRCFMAANKLRLPALASLALGVCNILMILFFCGPLGMGLTGIVLASSLAAVVLSLAVYAPYITRILPIRAMDIAASLLPGGLAFVVTWFVSSLASRLVPAVGWATLFGSALPAAAVSLGACFLALQLYDRLANRA